MYALTLNGANITQYSQVVGKLTVGIGSDTTRYSAGIWSNGTLYIELIGDNTVDLSGNDTVSDTSCAALYIGSYDYPKVYPYLAFSGSGSATFKGGNSDKNSCGIYSISNAIMNGTGTVTAEGGTCGAGGYYGYGSYGNRNPCRGNLCYDDSLPAFHFRKHQHPAGSLIQGTCPQASRQGKNRHPLFHYRCYL